MRDKFTYSALMFCMIGLSSCSLPTPINPTIPALDYTDRLKAGMADSRGAIHRIGQIDHLPPQEADVEEYSITPVEQRDLTAQNRKGGFEAVEMRASLNQEGGAQANNIVYQPISAREHQGPLAFGDPGSNASIWRESAANPDFFRDVRAFQPMDLITILISETSEGKKTANTETKSKSTVEAAIANLLGFEDDLTDSNNNLNLDSLVSASTQNDYKGEGKTDRKDNLKGTISAMVVEVLPSGIIRLEGSRIISVNNEEQVMVISGLARPRDIKSDNTIESSRLANMRIDYFGRGDVGDTQGQGWLGRLLRKVWPF